MSSTARARSTDEEDEKPQPLMTFEMLGRQSYEKKLEIARKNAMIGRAEEGSDTLLLYPNYITESKDGYIRADPDKQAPWLELEAPWLPIPWNVLAQKEIEVLSTKMLYLFSEDPAIVPFPVWTPPICALFCANASRGDLERMKQEQQFAIENYGHKIHEVEVDPVTQEERVIKSEVDTPDTLKAIYEILAFNAKMEVEQARLKKLTGTHIENQYCSLRLLVSFSVQKKIIEETHGLVSPDELDRFHAKVAGANQELKANLNKAAAQFYNINPKPDRDWGLPQLMKQFLDHGMVVNYEDCFNLEKLSEELIQYNMNVILAYENWFFTMCDIPVRLRFYHASLPNAVPSPFMISSNTADIVKSSIRQLLLSRLRLNPKMWRFSKHCKAMDTVQYNPQNVSIRFLSVQHFCNIAENVAYKCANDYCKGLLKWRFLQIDRVFNRTLKFEWPDTLKCDELPQVESVPDEPVCDELDHTEATSDVSTCDTSDE